jgi:hypothetical protein
MFGSHFYHERIRKSVAMFGSLFNNIHIVRKNASTGSSINQLRVPLSYAPADKYLIRIREQSNLNTDMSLAIKLPRMSFEMTSLAYDPTRQLPKTGKMIRGIDGDSTHKSKIYNSVPYNVNFQLNIFTRAQDDALQIVEQILPYFAPQYSLTVKPIADYPDIKEDVPVILTSVGFSDDYEGNLEDRRIIIYTLDFEMKLNFYSDIASGSIIRKAISNLFETASGIDGTNGQLSRVTTIPSPSNVSLDSDYGFTEIVDLYESIFAATYDLKLAAEPAAAQALLANQGISDIVLNDPGAGFNVGEAYVNIAAPQIPVRATAQVTDVSSFRVNAANITQEGTNYRSVPSVSFAPPPDPVYAILDLNWDSVTGKVSSVDVLEGGTNFQTVPNIIIGVPTGSDSSQALASLILSLDSNRLTGISLDDSGRYYGPGPLTTINYRHLGVDSSISLTANVTAGRITSINAPDILLNDSATITIESPNGTPADFRATALVTTLERSVTSVSIVDSGQHYLVKPSIFIDAPDAAVTATGIVLLNSQYQVGSITMVNKGSNYYTPPEVTISVPPAAIQAEIDVNINAFGQVSTFYIREPGTNYILPPAVSISNPIPTEVVDYQDSEQVTFTLVDGVIITALAKKWDGATNILTIDTIRASDNQVHTFEAGIDVTGSTSKSRLVLVAAIEGDKDLLG